MNILANILTMNGLTVFFLLLSGAILFKRIGHKYVEESVKRRCTQKTAGKIECISKGLYYTGMKVTKGRLPHPCRYTITFVFLHYTVYNYTANGKPYTGMDSRCAYTFFPSAKPGKEVEIYYNPNDGRDFYSPNDDWNAKYGHLVLIGLLFLITVGLSLLYQLFYYFWDMCLYP